MLTVQQACHRLVASGAVLLHGSNSTSQSVQTLQPRQANDAAKASGNRFAVYATADVEVALLNAVLNRRDLSQRLDSYVVGYRSDGAGWLTLRVTDNVYALALDDPAALWTDGFIHVVDRTAFQRDADGGSECWSTDPVEVLATFHVDASWGAHSFSVGSPERPGSIQRYGEAEVQRLGAHIAQLARPVGDGDTQMDHQDEDPVRQ